MRRRLVIVDEHWCAGLGAFLCNEALYKRLIDRRYKIVVLAEEFV